MSGFSPKVTAATVAASAASVVGGIVGPYVFPSGTPADVKGLWLAGVTAAVTFASGYVTKHPAIEKTADKVVSLADEVGKPFSQLAEYVEPKISVVDLTPRAPAPTVADAVPAPAPVAQPVAVLYPPQA